MREGTALKGNFARPVVFGLADGSMSILGVVFYASGHGGLVFPIALSGGVSAAVSMAGGEWLSESGNGLGASAAMGFATLAGSVLPAAPYAFLHGWAAPAVSVVILAAVAVVVARLRAYRAHPYAETAGVLAVVLAASVACALAIPAGTG
jgi:VIT1/CCC1 family predicted Fe2+/Mn2+ transporter